MPSASHSEVPRRRWRRILLAWGGAAVLFIGGLAIGGKLWAESYLRSAEFRRFVNARVGKTLKAEVEFAPFGFDGLSVSTDGLKARGFEGSLFASAKLEQIRARFSLRRFFDHVWQVDSVEAGRLSLNLSGSRLVKPEEVSASEGEGSTPSSSWLPNRVEVSRAHIQDVDITWGDLPTTAGALRGVEVIIVPQDRGWSFEGGGGELAVSNLPVLDVRQLKLREKSGTLYINSAEFLGRGSTGTISAEGEVNSGHGVDLRARLSQVDLAPFLSGDWRARLHGKASGDVRVISSLPAKGPVELSGTLQLEQARLEALPVLNQVALFTRTEQFRSVKLSKATARFKRDGHGLTVDQIIAESTGLIRIEGSFFVANQQIDGLFDVGVAPSTLQWLPGSQERVFTISRDGYLWTKMRLTGPVDSPKEDLSNRLVAAAGGAVVDKVESTARDALQFGKEAAKGALDLLFK